MKFKKGEKVKMKEDGAWVQEGTIVEILDIDPKSDYPYLVDINKSIMGSDARHYAKEDVLTPYSCSCDSRKIWHDGKDEWICPFCDI